MAVGRRLNRHEHGGQREAETTAAGGRLGVATAADQTIVKTRRNVLLLADARRNGVVSWTRLVSRGTPGQLHSTAIFRKERRRCTISSAA
jgi:hypothetical protein